MYTTAATYGTEQDRMIFGEKSDHLGNVRAVVSDIRKPASTTGSIDTWTWQADVRFSANYYDGVGMIMPGSLYEGDGYRFGAQGSEVETKIDGSRDHITTYYRNANLKTMRWSSPDPKVNASWSPYAMMSGNPVWFNDPLGDTVNFRTYSTEEQVNIVDVIGGRLQLKKDQQNPFTIDESGNLIVNQGAYDGLSEDQKKIAYNLKEVAEDKKIYVDVFKDRTGITDKSGGGFTIKRPFDDENKINLQVFLKKGTIYSSQHYGSDDYSLFSERLYHEIGGHVFFGYIYSKSKISVVGNHKIEGGLTIMYENIIRKHNFNRPERHYDEGDHPYTDGLKDLYPEKFE